MRGSPRLPLRAFGYKEDLLIHLEACRGLDSTNHPVEPGRLNVRRRTTYQSERIAPRPLARPPTFPRPEKTSEASPMLNSWWQRWIKRRPGLRTIRKANLEDRRRAPRCRPILESLEER